MFVPSLKSLRGFLVALQSNSEPLFGASLLPMTLATQAHLQLPKWDTLDFVPPSILTSLTLYE